MAHEKLFRITRDTETYADTYLGTFKGVPSFPLGDIVAIKGQAKSCKSTFLKIVTASIIGKCRKFGIEPITDVSAVHYFDTEQKINNTKQWLETAIQLGADEQRLYTYNLRALDTETRKKEIYEYIDDINALGTGNHLVILDGIRDIVSSPNDERECNEVKDKLLELLGEHPNVCIACVLHQNPNKEIDGKMRGHLGTEILNKCGAEWAVSANRLVEKDPLSPIVSYQAVNSASRGQSVNLPIVFSWENGEVVPNVPPMPMGTAIDERWAKVKDMLPDGQYKSEQLCMKISDACDVGKESAKKYLSQFVKQGYLIKPKEGTKGYYQIMGKEMGKKTGNG